MWYWWALCFFLQLHPQDTFLYLPLTVCVFVCVCVCVCVCVLFTLSNTPVLWFVANTASSRGCYCGFKKISVIVFLVVISPSTVRFLAMFFLTSGLMPMLEMKQLNAFDLEAQRTITTVAHVNYWAADKKQQLPQKHRRTHAHACAVRWGEVELTWKTASNAVCCYRCRYCCRRDFSFFHLGVRHVSPAPGCDAPNSQQRFLSSANLPL